MPTIYSVEKMWSQNSGDAELVQTGEKFSLGFNEMYQVVTDPDATILDVYQAPGLPAAGSSYPGFPYVRAQIGTPRQISPVLWHVAVDYRGEAAFANGRFGTPLDIRPTVEWSTVEVEREVDEDRHGNRITNVLGEAMTARVVFYERVATVTQNMLFFNTYALSDYDFGTNSDWFLNWPPGSARVKIHVRNVNPDRPGDIRYVQVTGYFTFKRPYRTTPDRVWWSRLRHEGFYHLPGNNPGPNNNQGPQVTLFDAVRAVDKNKVETTQPVQLDLQGYRLTNGTATWLEFEHFTPLPFANIGFNLP